jgi:4-amino-4-deoxy-L-arabinose transferase-like glycosyltransferase
MALLGRVFGLSRSLELWVDELVYTKLSATVSHGHLPNLFGVPFFLHPPGGFIIYGAIIKIFGISGSTMSMVYDLRWVSVVLGAVTVGLAFLLVRRITSSGIAWMCAVFLAFDPFIIRNNGRVFLETPAVIFIVGGYLLLAGGLHKSHARPSRAVLIVTGLLFGYAILTKDIFVLMTIVPTIMAGLWRATLPWRGVVVVCCVAVVPYISYIVLISANGLFVLWVKAKETGIERMVGLEQATGFNAPHAPSLLDRMVVQIGQFGTSYILLILCPIVGVVAARSRYPGRRIIGLCALTMGLFGMYAALFGTFEEQYGYGVMISSVLGVGIAFAEIRESRPEREMLLRVSTVMLMVLTIGLGVREEATPDDGFLQVRAWVQARLPAGAHVGVTNSTGQWAFMGDPRFGVWPSATSMWEHKADYVLTQGLPTSEGYGYAKPAMLQWLQANAVAVFRFYGPTNGNTVLWYVRPSLLRQAANAGIGS